MGTLPFILFISMYVFIFPSPAYAPVRGAPEGEPKVKVGDSAPLETEDLRKAHEQGKIILLMFGNPDHCRYCEKVWFNIMAIMDEYGHDKVAVILKIHKAAEFKPPDPEDKRLAERYGVVGEPWLILIDRKGIVKHIFRGFAGKSEIEAELKKAIRESETTD